MMMRAPGALLRTAVMASIPLSFGIWLAHNMFHFLTGGLTIIPVFQSFMERHGLSIGTPNWQIGSFGPLHLVMQWNLALQVTCVSIGLLASLYAGYKIGRKLYFTHHNALRGMLPLMLVAVFVAVAAVLIFLQPMEMRAIAG